jgi:hypothetical protein
MAAGDRDVRIEGVTAGGALREFDLGEAQK